MGFSITGSGNPLLTALFVFVLAVPAVIVIVWLFSMNREVRRDLHDRDEDEPIA